MKRKTLRNLIIVVVVSLTIGGIGLELASAGLFTETPEINVQQQSSESSDLDTVAVNNDTEVKSENIPVYIDEEEAKEIAYTHAGISNSEVVYTDISIDDESGDKTYEVDFVVGNKEYDYEVNAITGDVIKYNCEEEVDEVSVSMEATGNDIGGEAAKEIAIKDAGIESTSITELEYDVDYNNGYKVYEISFTAENNEYEYYIDALNGSIMNIKYESVN